MNLELYYRMLRHDPDGNLVKDTGLIPSGSFVIQFLEIIEAFMATIDKLATDVTGGNAYIVETNEQTRFGGVNAGALNDTYGLVVGTNAGTTAEDNQNYDLDTRILSSDVGEANKLNYRAVTFVAPRIVGPNIDFDVSRVFLNETGSTITVKEIGIICKNTQLTKYHLFLRDVVADEDVLSAYTLTVVYVLRTTA